MDLNKCKIRKKSIKPKVSKKELIKNAILSGRKRLTHYSNSVVDQKTPFFSFQCKCKCYSKLADEQIWFAFNHYYSLKSHAKQYAYLKGYKF